MIRLEIVQPRQWIPVIKDLMAANWAETGFDFEFDPSADMYQAIVDAGVMFVIAAFDGEQIVGYCTMMIAPTMHNPSVIIASNDAIFMLPNYRGITGGRMIRMAEREAKARGASRVLWHTRSGTKLHESMARHGYRPADIVMMKEI